VAAKQGPYPLVSLPPRQTRGVTQPEQPPLPRRLVLLMALTCGTAVANLYYAQPLLNRIASEFHVSDATAGLLVTCSQGGYVIGLALLVPLGDVLERRRLITVIVLIGAVAAAGATASPTFAVLALTLTALGLLSTVAQVVVPLSSELAAPDERGRVVGTVMSGLLIGILAARTLSGLVAEIGGWRLSFALASAVMLALAVLLRYALPEAPPPERVRYSAALRSVLALIAEEPVLRQRMVLGAFGFASFSILWTSVAFLLGGPPYHYSEGVIGLFGIAGIAGASAAPLAGRLADRGRGPLGTTIFLLSVLVSWGLLALGRNSVIALIAGIVVLDAGVQGAHIINQTVIYALRPDARSRVTTAYMVSMFLGAVFGSIVSANVYDAGGWGATCAAGAGVAGITLAFWALTAGRQPVVRRDMVAADGHDRR
jgi:predicted MFS family arabinose efflux permease